MCNDKRIEAFVAAPLLIVADRCRSRPISVMVPKLLWRSRVQRPTHTRLLIAPASSSFSSSFPTPGEHPSTPNSRWLCLHRLRLFSQQRQWRKFHHHLHFCRQHPFSRVANAIGPSPRTKTVCPAIHYFQRTIAELRIWRVMTDRRGRRWCEGLGTMLGPLRRERRAG